MSEGVLHSINVSNGGVPKIARDACVVRPTGLQGDRQGDLRYHGGPARAVSLFSLDLMRALQSEGHPIEPGSIGENLTVGGVAWTSLAPGSIVEVGEVFLEITSYAHPCQKIAGAFLDRDVARVSQKVHPGWSRLYARVVKEGSIRVGDPVRLGPTRDGLS